MPEICLRYAWDMLEICLRDAWDMFEICLRYAWDTPEIALRYAWDLSEISQGQLSVNFARLAGSRVWVKKCLGKKIFGSKRFGPKKNFVKKKTGRVNPRGEYMTPSPQKIVGLKFCWFVVSCQKKFFVKKKILVGLTLVGRGWWPPRKL